MRLPKSKAFAGMGQEWNRILSIDPSGSSVSGLFYYHHWGDWQAYSCPSKEGSKNWLDHAKFLEEEVKNKQIKVILVESGKIFSKYGTYRYSWEMDELIKCAGFCEYLGMKYEAEVVKISNRQRKHYEPLAKGGGIGGLSLEKIKRQWEGVDRQSSRLTWVFKGQELNEHEKDAVLMLFVYLTKKLKKEWPWEENNEWKTGIR